MKAAVRIKYGPPVVLSIKEIDKPVPKDDELLIKIYAATVNRTDCGILWGKPFIIKFFTGLPDPKLKITGTDFAGVVEAVGKNVNSFKIGDKVWGFDDNGLQSHTQFMVIKENKPVLLMPENLSFEEAAASSEGAHYAINFINKVKLEKGQNAMVYGATGAIGSAAVQLLKYYGLNVTAVCGTGYAELFKTMGADKVIDYKTQDFTKDKQKYDFVFDAVGKSTFSICKNLLKKNGVYISSELGPRNENIYLPLLTLFSDRKVKFPFPNNIKRSLTLIKKLIQEGKFKPVIDRKYPLEKIADAFNYAASGEKIGNVIITPNEKNL